MKAGETHGTVIIQISVGKMQIVCTIYMQFFFPSLDRSECIQFYWTFSLFPTGDGPGSGQAWGCDLSYDYVKINAEYTT